jgi:hypothetical protein
MAVTRAFVIGREQHFQEIDRLINSHSLRGSESLCKLLQYLAKHSLEHPGEPLKEYQIATEVYGRRPDFDPQSDSTIRVQAGRLRQKLADYYAGEGASDPVVVRIPKGSYHLSFESRIVDAQVHPGPTLAASGSAPQIMPVSPFWRLAAIVLAGSLITSLLMLGDLLWSKRTPVAAATTAPASRSLRSFWAPFISGPEDPRVIFSNAAFVGRPETGMRYYDSHQDSGVTVRDHYTGVGEVLAVHELDQVFDSLGRQMRVKRGSLFSLDDARNANLIFVGSPSENLSLLDIAGTQEFVFERMRSGPREGDLAVVVKHPRAGEAEAYLASPSNVPLTEDYGLVGLVPGLDPSRYMMILAGTTTFGTQGAVEFVCRTDSVEHLLQQIPGASSGRIRPFEALVRVKIARGVPLESELVAVRVR